ncbi:MAG: hypothetical protein NT158_06700 [Cyanobacteria bacterium]|jgi:hypothetical protein|nr:hypothetical protein [Cyanobacteriota bacterium]
MTPLPDRAVILGLLITIGLCFAMAFWHARLHPPLAPPLLWRDSPGLRGSSLL